VGENLQFFGGVYGLKNGETGIIFYGVRHDPSAYVKRYGPDINVIPLYNKKLVRDEFKKFVIDCLSFYGINEYDDSDLDRDVEYILS